MSSPREPGESREAILASRAARLAARDAQGDGARRRTPCVFSTFDRQRLAIPADRVRFVAPAPPVTALPGLPPWFAGVAAPRGQLVSILDPRGLVGPSPSPPAPMRFLIVLQGPQGALGLLMESLAGFGEASLDDLRPAPFDGGLALQGVWEDGTGLLDVTALMDDPRVTVGGDAEAPDAGPQAGGTP